MGELLHQLGIDWKHLLSQAVNFGIVLTVLTFFVFRPLSKLMDERKKKIELGLRGAEEVESRLKAIGVEKAKIIADAERSAVDIVGSAEKEGQKRIQDAVREADRKASVVMQEAQNVAERKRLEDLAKVEAQARAFVKQALIKTVELDPQAVDEALIDRAVAMVKQSS